MNSGLVKQTLRALRHKNYRLFFTGQSLSLVGTWMQSVALGWLVYRLTDSAFFLGFVGFSSQIPTFILASIAGVLADRYNKHKILIITQTLAMVQAFILAFLTLSSSIQIWHIILLSLFSGLINAFDMPTRQSFVIEMVDDRNDLPNAIALNSSVFNAARLIGPTIAGFLIAALGEGFCFLINAISYIAVIAALLLMNISPVVNIHNKEKLLAGLKDGIKYAYNFKPIRVLLLINWIGKLNRNALHCSDAGFRKRYFTGKRAYSRIFIWCCWYRSFYWSDLSCITKICFGFRKMDCYCSKHFFSRTFILFFFKGYLFVSRTYALHGIWNDDADGFNKHFVTNSR